MRHDDFLETVGLSGGWHSFPSCFYGFLHAGRGGDFGGVSGIAGAQASESADCQSALGRLERRQAKMPALRVAGMAVLTAGLPDKTKVLNRGDKIFPGDRFRQVSIAAGGVAALGIA